MPPLTPRTKVQYSRKQCGCLKSGNTVRNPVCCGRVLGKVYMPPPTLFSCLPEEFAVVRNFIKTTKQYPPPRVPCRYFLHVREHLRSLDKNRTSPYIERACLGFMGETTYNGCANAWKSTPLVSFAGKLNNSTCTRTFMWTTTIEVLGCVLPDHYYCSLWTVAITTYWSIGDTPAL